MQSSQTGARPVTGPSISVSGVKPPSRGQTQTVSGRATTSRSGTLASAVNALEATLIGKMRERFGEAAKDVVAQEAISSEVKKFMSKGGSMQEQDISKLEDVIRQVLSGRTPPRNTMVMDRKARLKGDEWARIWTYEAERVGREVCRDRDIDREKKAHLRRLLDGQVAEKEAAALAEKVEDVQAGKDVAQDVAQFEREVAAKKAREHEKIMHFKALQEDQVLEKEARVRHARDKCAQEEAATAARIAFEVKCEFEKEEATRCAAKKALVAYLAGNEENKKLRQAEKERVQAEDIEYMRKYEQILDKQQKERLARLEKLKAWQDTSEAKAASMPESKRWIDPALIQRNWEQNEKAQEAEQQRRKLAVVNGNKRMVSALNKQLAEKAALAREQAEAERKHSDKYLATAGAAEERAREERRKRMQLKLQAKLELEAQMRANAQQRREAPMSDVEKMVNRPLLQKVDKYETTHSLELKPFPAEFLPKDLQKTQALLSEQHARQRLKSARGLIASAPSSCA